MTKTSVTIWAPPEEPCPDPPAHHVATDACRHNWITWNDKNEPIWILCDCEDPIKPWPARKPTDGPVDCDCYFCMGKPRQDRGRAHCENENHHCKHCHGKGQCTTIECIEARCHRLCPCCDEYAPAEYVKAHGHCEKCMKENRT